MLFYIFAGRRYKFNFVYYLILLPELFSGMLMAQTLNNANEPPQNTFLGISPWPMMHRNPYSQASTPISGPTPKDELQIKSINLRGKVSPWMYFSEKYPNGQRVIWSSTTTHVSKTIYDGARLVTVSDFSINEKWFNFSPWNHILLKGNKLLVSDGTTLFILGDAQKNNPRSPIKILNQFELPKTVNGKVLLLNLSYDGWIIFNTDKGMLGAIDTDFTTLKLFQLPLAPEEIAWHNQFAIDEEGGIFIVTTKKMIRVNFRNQEFSLEWTANYDFIGDGPTSKLSGKSSIAGSGTTPTLMGWGKMDKLVVVVDGHNKANMVAFWRDSVPHNWQPLQGKDRRIAAITALPYAVYLNEKTWMLDYQAVENSPCARGYDIACAQYNGFNQKCNPVNGVQKLRWNPADRTLKVVWANNSINMNNVLTYSEGTNLVYGTGRKDCMYYFYALNWDTGNIEIQQPLGEDEKYNDQGCGNQISDDRTLMYSGANGIITIQPKQK